MECKHEFKRSLFTDKGNTYYCSQCDDFYDLVETHINKDKLYVRSAIFAAVVGVMFGIWNVAQVAKNMAGLWLVIIAIIQAMIMSSSLDKVWVKSAIRKKKR